MPAMTRDVSGWEGTMEAAEDASKSGKARLPTSHRANGHTWKTLPLLAALPSLPPPCTSSLLAALVPSSHDSPDHFPASRKRVEGSEFAQSFQLNTHGLIPLTPALTPATARL